MDNFDVSNFDPNAILRGAQLTLVGGKHRTYHVHVTAQKDQTDMCPK